MLKGEEGLDGGLLLHDRRRRGHAGREGVDQKLGDALLPGGVEQLLAVAADVERPHLVVDDEGAQVVRVQHPAQRVRLGCL